jgi:hypothetical protein
MLTWQGMPGQCTTCSLATVNAGEAVLLQTGVDLGQAIRKEAYAALGLRVSVGVARNCFLAKLASSGAKPDGLMCLEGAVAVQAALEHTSVERLPGVALSADAGYSFRPSASMVTQVAVLHIWHGHAPRGMHIPHRAGAIGVAGYGGKVAATLLGHGINTAGKLQALSTSALQHLCSLTAPSAQRLLQLAHGKDPHVPTRKPLPQTMSLQMTLTPVPVPVPRTRATDGGGPGPCGTEGDMLQPLVLGETDAFPRMLSLLDMMLKDLLLRVVQDRCVLAVCTV